MTSKQENSGDTEMKFVGVFKSLDAVKKCLHSDKYFSLPEVQELLKIFDENYSKANEVVDRSKRKVFIVLEGIDASGKTTISGRLTRLISGQQLGTPPPALLGLREKFDAHSLELRRAYYALGNYLAAQQVREAYIDKPVIMDRFWHSTAAYAIAQQAVEDYNGTLPAENDEVYEWPHDLLKPDIVFFLSVSESKRLDRLMRRKNKSVTREELRMKDNKELREALAQAYACMRNPSQIALDSDVTVEEVLGEIKKILEENYQIMLPEGNTDKVPQGTKKRRGRIKEMLQAYLRMKNPRVRVINADNYPKVVLRACTNTLTAEKLVKIDTGATEEGIPKDTLQT